MARLVEVASWVIFSFFCRQLIFFQNHFLFEKNPEYHQSAKEFGFRSGPTFSRPDLGPNCLHLGY